MKSYLGWSTDIILENNDLEALYSDFLSYSIDDWIAKLRNSSLSVINCLCIYQILSMDYAIRVSQVLSLSSFNVYKTAEQIMDKNMLMVILSLPEESLKKVYLALEAVAPILE